MYCNNKFYNTKECITFQDIREVEKKYQFTFPEEIRRHYLAFNGGKPKRCIFKDDESEYLVQKFFPIKFHNKNTGGTLESVIGMLKVTDKILPDWLIPLGVDPGGNLFCFSVKEGEEGAIYFWYHEYECGEDPEDHICFLADSLKSFVEGMAE